MYYHRNRNRGGKSKTLIAFLILVLIVLSLNFLYPPALFRPLASVASVFTRSFELTNNFLNAEFGSKQKLIEENDKLRQELEKLSTLRVENSLLALDFKRVMEEFGRVNDRNLLLSRVILKPNFSPYDTFLIDIGSDSGIEQGDLVLSGQSSAIGQIVEVSRSNSKAQLFSSTNSGVLVSIADLGIQVESYGQGGGNFYLELPRNTEIEKEDIIVLASNPDLVVGVVSDVESEASDPTKKVLFKTPVNIFEINWVGILKHE